MTIDHTPFGLGDDDDGEGQGEHTDFLTSDALDSMDYDPRTGDLTLSFTDGDVVNMSGVPKDVVRAMAVSQSPGAFYNLNVRGRF